MKKLILILIVGSLFGDTIKYKESLFITSTKENVKYLGISKHRVYYNNSNGIIESIPCNSVIEIMATSTEPIFYDCQESNYEPIELPPIEVKEKIGINSIVLGTMQYDRNYYQINHNDDLEKLIESYSSYYFGIGMTQKNKSIFELYFIMTNIRAIYKSASGFLKGFSQEYSYGGIKDSEKSIGFSYSKPILENMYITLGLNFVPRQKDYPYLSEDKVINNASRLEIKLVPKPFIGCRLYVPISRKLVLPIGINYYLPSVSWFAGELPKSGANPYNNYFCISSGIKFK